MHDDLDDLRSLFSRCTPAPDADRKAASISRAREIFAERQKESDPVRPMNEASENGGSLVQRMETRMSRWKTALFGSSGLVAAGLAVMVIMPHAGSGPSDDASQIFSSTDSLGRTSEVLVTPPPVTVDRMAAEELTAQPARQAAQNKAVLNSFRQMRPKPETRGIKAMPSQSFVVAPGHGPVMDSVVRPGPGDSFADVEASSVKMVADEPVSTFSIDVDTASYATVRSYLKRGQLPPADAVRVEEMVNYFPYDYAGPGDEAPFATHVSTIQTPWNADTRLVHIGIQGQVPDTEERPPLDLVFLVDTSGSMNSADRLGLLKTSLRMMLPSLRPEDRVGIVTYAGSAGVALEMTSAGEADRISGALEALTSGGSTAGAAGLKTAYDMLETEGEDGRIGRVILATDGDFNVGMSSTEEMKEFISDKRESGAYLSVLGFGHGNYNDALMQTLAQNGNGQAAFIDTLMEARKVMQDQLGGVLFPIADDVKIQVEFNPAAIAEYRLIGYETRALAREDFNNDAVDAGEIGAGHSVTALYEVTPVGSPAVLNDPLRYGAASGEHKVEAGTADELGFLKLRYKEPGEARSSLISTPIPADIQATSTEQAFAVAMAGFGQLLKGSTYLGDWSVDEAISLASGALGEDTWGYRGEAVSLMRLYEALDEMK